jgi:hypothetical protein
MKAMKNVVHLGLLAGWVLSRFEGPLATILVHLGPLGLLAALPRVFPLTLARYGLDVLRGA